MNVWMFGCVIVCQRKEDDHSDFDDLMKNKRLFLKKIEFRKFLDKIKEFCSRANHDKQHKFESK